MVITVNCRTSGVLLPTDRVSVQCDTYFQLPAWSSVTVTEAEYIHEVHITGKLPQAKNMSANTLGLLYTEID